MESFVVGMKMGFARLGRVCFSDKHEPDPAAWHKVQVIERRQSGRENLSGADFNWMKGQKRGQVSMWRSGILTGIMVRNES